MSKIKLDALNVEVSNATILDNEVHVNFEYELLSEREIKHYLDAFVGRSKRDCRYSLKMIFIVEVDEYYDKEELIENSIRLVVKPLVDIISMIDQFVLEERFN